MIFWGERNRAVSSSSSTYWIMWCTVCSHAVSGFGYRAGVAGQTGSRMRLTHLRPLALPLGSSLPLTPWLRIIADRDGEWELDAAAATSSPKPSSADIFLLCCEGKWEKTNIHNERNNKLSVGVCRKAKYTDFYLKILHAAGDWGVLQSRKGWKWLHFKCCPRIFALWPDLNGIQHHWNTNTRIQ